MKPLTVSPTEVIRQPTKGSPPGPTKLPPSGPQGLHSGLDLMQAGLKASQQQFNQLTKLVKRMDQVRRELTELATLGDMVTDEDVVEASGRLVAQGMEAHEVAGMLASLPAGGQALADWVQEQAAAAAQREQQLGQAHEMARHELGVRAFRALAAHHLAPPEAGPEGMAGNALTPGASPALVPDSGVEGNA